ncbi:MAG: hypothetical protein M1828_001416 [Chrysothrix sp. TS-e1954]|nr:MAG: hypothetical protein M1828_001416 [Chrysothrix sp. TS-e1954]
MSNFKGRSFLDLPLEVRNRIYTYVSRAGEGTIVYGSDIEDDVKVWDTSHITSELSLACWQTYNESITKPDHRVYIFYCDLREAKCFMEQLDRETLALIERVDLADLAPMSYEVARHIQRRGGQLDSRRFAKLNGKKPPQKAILPEEEPLLSWIVQNTQVQEISAFCLPEDLETSMGWVACRILPDKNNDASTERKRVDEVLLEGFNTYLGPVLRRINEGFSYTLLAPSLCLSTKPRFLRKVSLRLPYVRQEKGLGSFAYASARRFRYRDLNDADTDADTNRVKAVEIFNDIVPTAMPRESHMVWEKRNSHVLRGVPHTSVVLEINYTSEGLSLIAQYATKYEDNT